MPGEEGTLAAPRLSLGRRDHCCCFHTGSPPPATRFPSLGLEAGRETEAEEVALGPLPGSPARPLAPAPCSPVARAQGTSFTPRLVPSGFPAAQTEIYSRPELGGHRWAHNGYAAAPRGPVQAQPHPSGAAGAKVSANEAPGCSRLRSAERARALPLIFQSWASPAPGGEGAPRGRAGPRPSQLHAVWGLLGQVTSSSGDTVASCDTGHGARPHPCSPRKSPASAQRQPTACCELHRPGHVLRPPLSPPRRPKRGAVGAGPPEPCMGSD